MNIFRIYIVCSYVFADFLNAPKKVEISTPYDPVHLTHVGINSSTGEFTGLPKEWQQLLQENGISKLDQEKNPQAVMEIVKFYQEGGGETQVWDKMGGAAFGSKNKFLGGGGGVVVGGEEDGKSTLKSPVRITTPALSPEPEPELNVCHNSAPHRHRLRQRNNQPLPANFRSRLGPLLHHRPLSLQH